MQGQFNAATCTCDMMGVGDAGADGQVNGGDAGADGQVNGGDAGADASNCPLTGIVCIPTCAASGHTDGGAPCTRGQYNPATCNCDPVGGSDAGPDSGADAGTNPTDGGSTTDGGNCPLTGIACIPTCPASGHTDGGVPCTRGQYNPATCNCDPING